MKRETTSYSTDVEGDSHVAVRYAIEGKMRAAEYLDFIAERATWFGVSGWASANDERSVTLVAAGPEAMVGALEMACTLGPITAVIDRIHGAAETENVELGFEIRG